MNQTIKIILGLVAGIVVLCLITLVAAFSLFGLGGRVVASALDTNPDNVASIGSQIADYTLPEGFSGAFASHLAGFSTVGYNGSDNHSHIYFVQLPKSITLNEAEIQRQLQQAVPSDQYSRPERMIVVDRGTASIRGQMATVIVSEGTNHSGQAYREVSSLFEGKNGQAMVVFERPVKAWDQAEVDAFLASIR